MKHVLVVDDEIGARESLKAILSPRHRVTAAAGAKEALEALRRDSVDLILLDVLMPGQNGLKLLEEVRELHPDMPVVMVSASTPVKSVVEAMRAGAYDYVQKPFDCAEILLVAERAMEGVALHRRVKNLESEVARIFPTREIVGESPSFLAALDSARKAAATDATVLIMGESGTGKELLARFIHDNSPRRAEPFVAVHCAALPESLMESELFGHEKGAFTNANQTKLGRFELAGSGTLFFDEAGEMTPATQVKLLRVLQEREFMRVGGTRAIRTQARILAASARDLRDEARKGRFREDLLYRINVVPLRLPPLRERPDDILRLARYFLKQLSASMDTAAEGFHPETMERMLAYPWPGNTRELRNIVEQMLVLHGRHRILPAAALPREFHGPAAVPADELSNGLSLREILDEHERRLIREALRRGGQIQTRAAELLGTTRRVLRCRMEKLGLRSERNRIRNRLLEPLSFPSSVTHPGECLPNQVSVCSTRTQSQSNTARV